MASLINVLDIYNEVATITGFPRYTNETDTPDITRFLLEMISEGLRNTIDNLYTNNNVLERTDTINTVKGQDEYGVDGLIRHCELVRSNGSIKRLNYLNDFDFLKSNDKRDKESEPIGYVIKNGYLRLHPVPDKSYQIKLVLSTNDLVLSNNDSYRRNVTNINDKIIADKDFADILKLRIVTLILMRANNQSAQIYANILNERSRNYIERDYGSNEAERAFGRRSGHYDPNKGLLG